LTQGKLIEEFLAIKKVKNSFYEDVQADLRYGCMVHKVQIRGELDEREALVKIDNSNKGMFLKDLCEL
jgi:hypothetical protein